MTTYETAGQSEADRAQQKALLAALNGWDRALRRDECGAWRISGAEVIRDVLGIRKRVEFPPEELERRRVLMKRLALAPGSANAGDRWGVSVCAWRQLLQARDA